MSKSTPLPTPYEKNPTAVPKILTAEERHDIETDRKAKDLFRDEEGIAKFKIELLFNKEFSIIKPVPGIMSFWESGSHIHGGGDSILHFCPGKKLGINDCDHYIPDPSHGYEFLVCPRCHKVWKGKDVFGQVVGRHTAKQWAELICVYYRRLDMRCDVVIKYHSSDIRSAARARHVEDKLFDVRAPTRRLKRIYTMSSLIQDLSAGATLDDRILAFVRA